MLLILFIGIRILRMTFLLIFLNFTISHVHREGNACADWLANLGCNLEFFTNFTCLNLLNMLKGLISLDKMVLPYVRI
ncbi:hypothetical protein M5K25_003793 [Dendrobium thyrsiflorum]|uniref:RNase H type-1 domain-containing protein n=1 Tax=Dendrobium thyrsiflorum TaxID=117978 RepID=A0ABD0VSF1_DENTH